MIKQDAFHPEATVPEPGKTTDARFGFSPAGAVLLFSFPFLALAVAGVIRLFDKALLHRLTAEDSIVEWVQVLCLCVGVAFGVLVLRQFVRRSHWLLAGLYGVLVLGLVFITGEEIAWGQRLVGFQTPESLKEINNKGETSVHNISSIEPWFNVGKLWVGAYGAFGFLLLRRFRSGKSHVFWRFLVIPACLSSAFFFIFLQRVLRLTVMSHKIPVDYGEFEELCFAYGIAMFVVLVWWQLRRQPSPIRPQLTP